MVFKIASKNRGLEPGSVPRFPTVWLFTDGQNAKLR